MCERVAVLGQRFASDQVQPQLTFYGELAGASLVRSVYQTIKLQKESQAQETLANYTNRTGRGASGLACVHTCAAFYVYVQCAVRSPGVKWKVRQSEISFIIEAGALTCKRVAAMIVVEMINE